MLSVLPSWFRFSFWVVVLGGLLSACAWSSTRSVLLMGYSGCNVDVYVLGGRVCVLVYGWVVRVSN
jgi:hypothetical protein